MAVAKVPSKVIPISALSPSLFNNFAHTKTYKLSSKFKLFTARVKGLSFHPRRPWIAISCHSGQVEIWDYQLSVKEYEIIGYVHPVRCIDFHPTQPLLAVGCDNRIVTLWNYDMKTCEATLRGHLDYVRAVNFHSLLPLLVSAGDDQVLRVWSVESKKCLAVLAGHSHYAMSATFHSTEDLIISASLDKTVRIWDFSRLKSALLEGREPQGTVFYPLVYLKFVFEGHLRGVNCAQFHPTLPIAVSSSDDQSLRIWRIDPQRGWEVDSLQGHQSNVSAVVFHRNIKELILSAGEDKTFRVWDVPKRKVIYQSGSHDQHITDSRLWALITHPTNNLCAVGDDNGMVILDLCSVRTDENA